MECHACEIYYGKKNIIILLLVTNVHSHRNSTDYDDLTVIYDQYQ